MPMTFLRAGETGMIQRVGGAEDTKRFLANRGRSGSDSDL